MPPDDAALLAASRGFLVACPADFGASALSGVLSAYSTAVGLEGRARFPAARLRVSFADPPEAALAPRWRFRSHHVACCPPTGKQERTFAQFHRLARVCAWPTVGPDPPSGSLRTATGSCSRSSRARLSCGSYIGSLPAALVPCSRRGRGAPRRAIAPRARLQVNGFPGSPQPACRGLVPCKRPGRCDLIALLAGQIEDRAAIGEQRPLEGRGVFELALKVGGSAAVRRLGSPRAGRTRSRSVLIGNHPSELRPGCSGPWLSWSAAAGCGAGQARLCRASPIRPTVYCVRNHAAVPVAGAPGASCGLSRQPVGFRAGRAKAERAR